MRPPVRPRRTAPLPAPGRPGAGRTPGVRTDGRTAAPTPGARTDGRTEATGDGTQGRDVVVPQDATPDAGRTSAQRSPAPWVPARPPVVSPGSAARFAERVALRRRLVRRKAGWVVAVAVLLAATGWLLLISPVLALDASRIEVAGEGTVVDASVVRDVVARHDGTPLPRLDTVALRREVLDVPGVRAAEVARVWPHGVSVTVVSREPVAAVPHADGGVALLDADGVQVGRSEAAPDGLPVVDVPLDEPGARTLTAVLTVLQQLPDELAAEVVAVSARTQDTVRLTLADGAVVEWGSADQGALKARVLQTLRAAEASSGASVFDVSAPTLPITRS